MKKNSDIKNIINFNWYLDKKLNIEVILDYDTLNLLCKDRDSKDDLANYHIESRVLVVKNFDDVAKRSQNQDENFENWIVK